MREAKYLPRRTAMAISENLPLPRRCRDGLQKNLLILTIVTVLD
jgi:hypothetical protein